LEQGAYDREPFHVRVDAPEKAASHDWWVTGWLTAPAACPRHELQILLHGAGYDHRYWDWPVEPERYSYVAWAGAHGRATLNLDRVGSGSSSRPPGIENTVAAQAEVLEQVVQRARAGEIGGIDFERVLLVGHSLGSVIAGAQAATWGDVDGVVLTGYVPVAGTVGSRRQEEGFAPAAEVLPHLTGLVDGDYLALPAGVRDWLMYVADNADPALIALDEQSKGVTSRGEMSDAGSAGKLILGLTLPTLVVAGQYDRLLVKKALGDADCHDTMHRAADGLPANFAFEVVEGSGHNVNLHYNARDGFAAVERWLDALDGIHPEKEHQK
jgi:pimeloyl-ACP methyl ester carboxylesterase